MVNKERVQRLWRETDLKVFGQKAYKETSGSFRKGLHKKACRTHRKIGSYDLVMDRTDDGRRLKMLAVVEECTSPLSLFLCRIEVP